MIGRGIQGASTGVITTKYGDDAGKMANEGFETVGNIGQVGRVYKDGAIKAI